MSFRRSAFPGNFRKFLEISGGRRSAVGGRLRSAVGLPPPEVRFPWKFPESCFLSRGQISKRMSRNLGQGQHTSAAGGPYRGPYRSRAARPARPRAPAPAGPRRDEYVTSPSSGVRDLSVPDGPRGAARAPSQNARSTAVRLQSRQRAARGPTPTVRVQYPGSNVPDPRRASPRDGRDPRGSPRPPAPARHADCLWPTAAVRGPVT